ncbi:MAG: tetraacyldisaccharide 4'-kinase, partial [Anaeromyxobacteraceae bacterium]
SLRALARSSTGRAPVESRHAPRDLADGTLRETIRLDALSGQRVALLTGVARPASVRRTVEGLGALVVDAAEFPDHHRFTAAEVEGVLRAAARAGAARVVTTEKDAVRLPESVAGDPRLRVLRIDVEVTGGGDALAEALSAALQGRDG